VPFESSSATGLAYADTTFRTIRDFLRPILAQTGTVITAVRNNAATASPAAQAYPIPAEDAVRVLIPETWALPLEAQLLDAAGRVVRTINPRVRDVEVLRGALRAGLYSIKFPGQVPIRIEFR
jgi:hypothetical protein